MNVISEFIERSRKKQAEADERAEARRRNGKPYGRKMLMEYRFRDALEIALQYAYTRLPISNVKELDSMIRRILEEK